LTIAKKFGKIALLIIKYMVGISKICFSNPKETNYFVKCLHSFPSLSKKKTMGELLFIIEIKVNKEKNETINLAEEISEIIINGMRTNYYSQQIEKDEEVEQIFEESLQKLNRLLYQESMSSKNFENLLKGLSAVIVLVFQDKIYFSSVGSIKVFILKKNKIVDLVKEEISFSLSKVFSQIISGVLEKKDVLFFSTANFLDYFVFEKLKNIVFKHSSFEIEEKLKESLENFKDKISLCAFVIKEEVKVSPMKIKVIPEEKVEEVSIKMTTPVEIEKFEKEEIEKKEEKVEKLEKEEIKPAKEVLVKREEKKEITPLKIKLPKIKIKSFIALVLILLLIGLFSLREKSRENEFLKFFLSLEKIQEKIAILKASEKLEKEKVLSLAKEAEVEIDLFKAKNRVEKEILQRIKNDLKNELDKAFKIQRIKSPKLIFDLSFYSKNFVKIGNFLFSLDKDGKIYQIDLKNNKILEIGKIDTGNKKIVGFDSENLIFYDSKNLLLFNLKEKKVLPIKIETSVKNFIINDLKVYDRKVYILNLEENQILKYLVRDSNLVNETKWLKEKIEFKNVVSFAIDGSIYLLKENGEVIKFYLGKKQAFNLEKVYPSFEKVEKILTEREMKNIYLFEPKNKRIIIFDKDGKIKKQIILENIKSLLDFVVSENEKEIFILDGSKIYKVEL